MVVYSLYKEGHNSCNKKKIGTYQSPVSTYLKANGAQQTKEAEISGSKYQGQELTQYLYCTASKINDVYVSLSLW